MAGKTPLRLGIACSPIAAMIAKICAPNMIRILLEPPEHGRVLCNLTPVSHNRFKTVVDVLVFVTERLIPLEQEDVGVAAVGDSGFEVRVELLRCASEPSFRPLPGVVIAIKTRCTKSTIIPGDENAHGA
jgi:hypothetical protein